MGSPDDALVARLLAREDKAWEELLSRFGGVIDSACRRTFHRAGRPADADARAEVIRALLDRDSQLLRAFRTGASLEAYLRVIARSRTLDLLRRSGAPPSPLLSGDALAVEDPLEAEERSQRLQKALESLPQRDATALRLFHLDGLPYAEIARRTGLAEASMGETLARARRRLKEALGGTFLESV